MSRSRQEGPEQILQRAVADHQSGNLLAAEAGYKLVLAFNKNQPDALHLLGVLNGQRGNFDEASRLLRKAVRLNPKNAACAFNYGNVLLALGLQDDALANFDKAIALNPGYVEAYLNRGSILLQHAQFVGALASFDNALKINPDYSEAHSNRGNALQKLGQLEEAIVSHKNALRINSNNPEYYYNLANTLRELGDYDGVKDALGKALSISPNMPFGAGDYLDAKIRLCDWSDLEGLTAQLFSAVRRGILANPFPAVAKSPSDELICARNFVMNKCPPNGSFHPRRRPSHRKPLRIAYCSSDFHNHATAHLTAGLFEAHDRSQFETTAISLGPDQAGEMRERLKGSFDRFVDVRLQSDQGVVNLLQKLETDIAIDLNGFTQRGRPKIFARRPAPIQVNYLGYPGTMGAEYIDYILADRIVIPEDQHEFYAEKVVYLPDCYQPNDNKRQISQNLPTRQQAGLPQEGFVFCSFNNAFKILPDVFDVWMRLLQAIDGSVLWLLDPGETARKNLCLEAEKRRVSANRLVFAPRAAPADHLERHRLADLFIDTLPYNAHTTASDALWAGLPVLTCSGPTFASRVAASLLNAVGLSDLTTHSLDEYEALALKLARERDFLAALKARLSVNRKAYPLFDTKGFARHIEAAFIGMWERYCAGQHPESFAVESIKAPCTISP